MRPTPIQQKALFWVATLTLVAYRLFRVDDVIYARHAWRQADTAMMVEAFARFGTHLLAPMVGWLGPYHYRAYEFPLIQAIAAELYDPLGHHPAIFKAIVLVFFLAGAGYLYDLMRRMGNAVWAAFAILFYLAMPLGIYYSTALQVDFITVTASLGCFYHAVRYASRGSQASPLFHLVAFGTWFALAGLLKPPYLLPVGVALAVWLWQQRQGSVLVALALWAVPGMVLTLGWISYSAKFNQYSTPYLGFLTSMNRPEDAAEWYFGTLAQRLQPGTYLMLARRFLNIFSLPLCALAVSGMALVMRNRVPGGRIWVWYLAGCAAMLLVIFNLSAVHDYYQTPFVVPLAVPAAVPLTRLWSHRPWVAVGLATVAVVYGLAFTHLRYYARNLWLEQAGAAIAQRTAPNHLVFFVQNGIVSTNPELPAYSNRFGFCMGTQDLTLARLDSVKLHGINTIALVQEAGEAQSDNLQEAQALHKLDSTTTTQLPVGGQVVFYEIR